MANFQKALNKLLINEGTWVDDPSDSGGETYRGISKKYNKDWDGWEIIKKIKDQEKFNESLDRELDTNLKLSQKVKRFYKVKFWDSIRANEINSQSLAESIFDFAVNAGIRTSVRLAQGVLGVSQDGVLGPKTLEKLNSTEETYFLHLFALQKINRYLTICKKSNKNRKFFFGWIDRSLRDLVF